MPCRQVSWHPPQHPEPQDFRISPRPRRPPPLGAARAENPGATKMAEPTKEELLARIAELEKQSGARVKGSLEFRVGEKGGVSVYGLGRFPVTLYYEQWTRL